MLPTQRREFLARRCWRMAVYRGIGLGTLGSLVDGARARAPTSVHVRPIFLHARYLPLRCPVALLRIARPPPPLPSPSRRRASGCDGDDKGPAVAVDDNNNRERCRCKRAQRHYGDMSAADDSDSDNGHRDE